MFKSFEEADGFIKQNRFRMVDLKFSDLWGRWHHVTISAVAFTPDLMASGVGFDGSSVGLKSVKSGDMALIPDLKTGIVDPFCEVPTVSFICFTVEADTKSLFARDPRVIARRAEEYMKKTGIADTSKWGPEFEFYIFNTVSFENTVNRSMYSVDSPEGIWNSCSSGSGYQNPLHGGYHAIPPRDHYFNVRSEMVTTLESIGIPIKYHHHEVGGPGQSEIETPMLDLIHAADSAMLVKYVTRLVATKYNCTVTFLPKPLFGEAGSGMHFHIQLFKDKKNLFYDPAGPSLMSQAGLFFIGGLLTHADSLLAFTNPSTNSYRRLVPGFEAPVNAFFSTGNRSAAIRIPKYATQSDTVRFEFRPPDATCNPYLATSAMLLAGLDGIQRKLDPSTAGFGPINEDIFDWPPEKRSTIHSLPSSLRQALDALQGDHDYLLMGDVFDEGFIFDWIQSHRKEDLMVNSHPHPYEIQLYYDL